MNDDNEQLEFDFTPTPCTCNETTKYEDLCPVCLSDCLEYMDSHGEEDYSEYA